MYKKFNIKILAAILVLLVIAVIAVYLSDSAKGERSFRARMVDADTAKITKIVIYPKANKEKAIELKNESGKWKVVSGTNEYKADESMIKGILGSLADMKPEQLVATDKSHWGKFDVTDSAATKVKLYTGKKLATNLYIGRFNYQAPKNQNPYNYGQQGTITTYVRLADEKSVYSVEGYIGMTLERQLNDFRDKTLVRCTKDDLNRIDFTYPADSSFTMTKEGNTWTINGIACDSIQVANYLSSLSILNGSAFNDDGNVTKEQPVFTVSIGGNNMPSPVVVKAFAGKTPTQLILNSSLNNEAFFVDNNASLAQKIYVSKSKFFKERLPTR